MLPERAQFPKKLRRYCLSCIPCVPDFILPASRKPGNFVGIIKIRTQCLRWISNRTAETCPFCKSISAAENSPITLMAAADMHRKAQPQVEPNRLLAFLTVFPLKYHWENLYRCCS